MANFVQGVRDSPPDSKNYELNLYSILLNRIYFLFFWILKFFLKCKQSYPFYNSFFCCRNFFEYLNIKFINLSSMFQETLSAFCMTSYNKNMMSKKLEYCYCSFSFSLNTGRVRIIRLLWILFHFWGNLQKENNITNMKLNSVSMIGLLLELKISKGKILAVQSFKVLV